MTKCDLEFSFSVLKFPNYNNDYTLAFSFIYVMTTIMKEERKITGELRQLELLKSALARVKFDKEITAEKVLRLLTVLTVQAKMIDSSCNYIRKILNSNGFLSSLNKLMVIYISESKAV